jgi:peptidoglycan hydrolase CwlO-like protein
MMPKNKKLSSILLSSILLLGSLAPSPLTHINASDCDDLEGDAKDSCEEYSAKIKAYLQIIELKQRQGATLADQIEGLTAQIDKLQLEIDQTTKKIHDLEGQIQSLTQRIAEKSIMIDRQKKILSALMQVYYSDYSSDSAPLLLTSEESLAYFKNEGWTSNISYRVSDTLDSVKTLRESLTQEHQAVSDKKTEVDALYKDLDERNKNLESSKKAKADLLLKTKAEEAKYQTEVARLEAQKEELFDFSSASDLNEVLDSLKDYPAPDKDEWASTSWYFSQRDSRWGNKTIGNSRTLMKDYGCAVTSVSMVFRYHGSSTDPGKMAKEPIFSYDLIKWPGSWSPDIDLVSSVSHGNVSWSTIDAQLKKNNPVIVYIKKTNNRGGHYVVITGKDSKDYIVHDPYFAPNIYLNTSRSLFGKLGADSGTRIDQMIIYQ